MSDIIITKRYPGSSLRPGPKALKDLWFSVGWDRGSIEQPKRLSDALGQSTLYLAVDKKNMDRLIGILSVIDDGFNAVITWLVVHKDFHGQGVGTKLMEQFINDFPDYRWQVQSEKAAGFYEKFGFNREMTGLARRFA